MHLCVCVLCAAAVPALLLTTGLTQVAELCTLLHCIASWRTVSEALRFGIAGPLACITLQDMLQLLQACFMSALKQGCVAVVSRLQSCQEVDTITPHSQVGREVSLTHMVTYHCGAWSA